MDTQGLSLLCSCLGVAEEDRDGNRIGYSTGKHCLENLKDLLRFLRRDDPQTRPVFKQVCKWNTVSKDLIPIIQHHRDDHNLVLNVVKIMVFLTMPIESASSDVPQQIEYLWDIKAAITNSDAVPVFVSMLEGPLENLERESFTEDNWKLVQLMLTLFRNILAIQEMSSSQKIEGVAHQFLSLREKFLELLFHEHVMDLIIVISQYIGDFHGYLRHDNLLMLEIFHFIFAGQDPEFISKAHIMDSKACTDSLKFIMDEEKEKRKLYALNNMGRHSQFSGTFSRLAMDGSKIIHKGNHLSTLNSSLKPHKLQSGLTKRIAWETRRFPPTKDNILKLLHDFLNQFLSGSYNGLMQSILQDIVKEHHAIQNSDIIVFFHVSQFVISFQYHKFLILKSDMKNGKQLEGDVCGPISETMNELMFSFVISRWRKAFDGLKETSDYKFLSASCSILKIMIFVLDLVLKLFPEDSKEPQTARILLYKLFYDQSDQGMTQFLLSLIKSFDTHKQPKSDLADLVETIHVIVKLMENLQARGKLRVSKKSRKSRKKKTLPDQYTATAPAIEEEASQRSQSIAEDPLLQSTIDVPHDDNDDDNNDDDDDDDDSLRSSHSSGEEQATTCEVDLDVSALVSSLANHSIIRNLCWLLRFYKNNHGSTNHCVVSILRRITDDLDLSPMLYQLSLVTIFHDILVEQNACPSQKHADIAEFLTRLVRRMLRKMKRQPLLFLEILFWKTRKECHYVDAESLLHELRDMKKESSCWGNEPLNHRELPSSEPYVMAPRSLADALGEDEADVVISHDLSYLNEENTIEIETQVVSNRKKRLVLTKELECSLRDLYEKFKDDGDCCNLIAESLDQHGQVSASQVLSKLKQLGLKLPRKKRIPHGDEPSSSLEKEVDLHNSVGSESVSKKSPKKKTRSQAFSRDQEDLIRSLFEQFRDHKRCNHMILNALPAPHSFTPAQISQKLIKLGLRVPRRRNSQIDARTNSDDETLSSLKKRKLLKKSSKQKMKKVASPSSLRNGEGSIQDAANDEASVINYRLVDFEDDDLSDNHIVNDDEDEELVAHFSARIGVRKNIKMIMNLDEDD